jgi:transposase InsO family protein
LWLAKASRLNHWIRKVNTQTIDLRNNATLIHSLTREAARQGVFEYIEMFYNPKRKHTNNGMLSPVDFETRQQTVG